MSVVFDTAEYLDAVQPPVFRHRGLDHVGRVLSIEEYWSWQPRLRPLYEGRLRLDGIIALVRDFFDEVFPPPVSPRRSLRERLFRARAPTEPSVADLVATLPLQAQLEALASFAHSQAAAHGIATSPREPTPPLGTTTEPEPTTAPADPPERSQPDTS